MPERLSDPRCATIFTRSIIRDVDMVAAWSVDRLGRSLIDLLDFLRELHAKGVDLFLHQHAWFINFRTHRTKMLARG